MNNVLVFCHDEFLRSRLVKACGAYQMIQSTDDWGIVMRLCSTTRISILGIPNLNQSVARRVLELAALGYEKRILLVTNPDPEGLVHLRHMTVSEVIWVNDVEQKLENVLRHGELPECFLTWAARIQSSPHIPSRLRQALVSALVTDPPFPTVQAWARALGLSTATLRRKWRYFSCETSVNQSGLSPKEFLVDVKLGRTIAARGCGMSWKEIRYHIGVDVQSIRPYFRKLWAPNSASTYSVRERQYKAYFERRWLHGLDADDL